MAAASDRTIDGSVQYFDKTSIPVMPWGGEMNTPKEKRHTGNMEERIFFWIVDKLLQDWLY